MTSQKSLFSFDSSVKKTIFKIKYKKGNTLYSRFINAYTEEEAKAEFKDKKIIQVKKV